MLGVEGVLVDLDGVLYIGDEAIPGAAEALSRFREAGLALRGVTNTTTKSAGTLAARLADMGLPLGSAEIVTAPRTAVNYLRTLDQPTVRLVLSDDAASEFSEFDMSETDPDIVIIGDIGDGWDYALMSNLFECITNGASLVALHKGRYYQGPDGLILDIGAFVTGLEYATSTKAKVIGKPSQEFFQLAVSDMGLKPGQVVMVGDDIESDIGGAQRSGLQGVLVRTGKYREHLVEKSMVEPDAVVDSIVDVPQLLRD
jgi:HAD superfamily hydrolase (TIGR01458 family)